MPGAAATLQVGNGGEQRQFGHRRHVPQRQQRCADLQRARYRHRVQRHQRLRRPDASGLRHADFHRLERHLHRRRHRPERLLSHSTAPGTILLPAPPALSGARPGGPAGQALPALLGAGQGNNTYSGGTLVTSGTIGFGSDGLGTGPVVVNPGNGNTAGLTWTATTDLTTNQTAD